MSELAEGARLEIVCAVKSGTEGSNPSLSAIIIQGVRKQKSENRGQNIKGPRSLTPMGFICLLNSVL
jgi:hypothetical protein